jgi:hypothetical protein
MEPTFQLTPESARALARRLFTKEQFAANPRACIIGALDWLDQAARDPKPGESAALVKPPRDRCIEPGFDRKNARRGGGGDANRGEC